VTNINKDKVAKQDVCVVCNGMAQDYTGIKTPNRFKFVLITLMHILLVIITFGVWLGVMAARDTSNRCVGCNKKTKK